MSQILIPSHEKLCTGFMLAAAGGFLDAYTYLTRGGVFANAQTGNIVLLALNTAEGRVEKALYYLIPIGAFAAGVFVTEYIKKKCREGAVHSPEGGVLFLEIVLLLIIGFLPEHLPDSIVNVSVSFICSLQVNTFRKVREMPYASTMCTGNLRSGTERLFRFLAEKEMESGRYAAYYFGIIFLFMAGVAVGAVSVAAVGTKSVWLCCLLLGVVLCILILGNKKGETFRNS